MSRGNLSFINLQIQQAAVMLSTIVETGIGCAFYVCVCACVCVCVKIL